jgi:hypothetical protein
MICAAKVNGGNRICTTLYSAQSRHPVRWREGGDTARIVHECTIVKVVNVWIESSTSWLSKRHSRLLRKGMTPNVANL